MNLPLRPEHVSAAESKFLERFASADDSWFPEAVSQWKLYGIRDPRLRGAVESVIKDGFPDATEKFAGGYFRLFDELVSKNLPRQQAEMMLSLSPVIKDLATRHAMTASRILSILDEQYPIYDPHWDKIQLILRHLGCEPHKPARSALEALTEEDRSVMAEYFSDAGQGEAFRILEEALAEFGVNAELVRPLSKAVDARHVPYLQMLHIQLCITAFYDSRMQVAYEFTPRGSEWAAVYEDLYPDDLRATQSPFLNNAKSVYELNEEWARSKGNRRSYASSLVQVLQELDQTPLALRRQAAQWLRAWILRILELAVDEVAPRPGLPSKAQAARFLQRVCQQNTGTTGILEQRVVDLYAFLSHHHPGVAQRGLGDSVHAANLWRRKLGDVEFSSVPERHVDAFEAHGGVLNADYVEMHLRTFGRTVLVRKAEWEETVEAAGEWSVDLTFIAHSLDTSLDGLEGSRDIQGVDVTLCFKTFTDVVTEILNMESWKSAYDDVIDRELYQIGVRRPVRELYVELMTEE
ncbi:hypothetical protein [uncultured Ornithinimicrobium sp.]|uniref:hypothetical protein n=1 Tax=uncultured Ornithinimicrobium sp. TaxID=259307 RepID=UPI002593FEB2|nr:hypothetical protein [uncultured Ornithinimicrobium sp.]